MIAKGSRVSYCDENVLKFIVMMAAQFHHYTKNDGIIHFKWMSCIACGLNLNKAVAPAPPIKG